jgi:hypothetical protein
MSVIKVTAKSVTGRTFIIADSRIAVRLAQ